MRQDRNGVRTAQDLERRYDFSSLLGLKRAVIQNETGLTKIENELNNFTIATLSQVENLQDQIDGNITTYYYSGVPTLTNLPTSEWNESQYNIHLGDLYYDKDTGYAYRFYLDSETNVYGWIRIKDSDVVEALSIANSANDTADSKRRVFVTQPQPPYDNGDLWLKDQELYVCQISKQTGNYEDGDFIIATKYTDDTYAEQVNNTLTVFSGKVTKEISATKARIDIVETATTTNGESISTLQTRATEIEANLEGVTSTVTEANNKYTQLSQRADSISAEVSNKADKIYVDTKLKQSDTVSGNLPLHYENSAGKDLIKFKIEGNCKQETTEGYNLFNGDFRTGNSANLNDKTRLFSTQVLYLKAGTYKATTNLDTTKYQFQHYTFSTTANPTAPVANILFALGGWSTNKQCIINITEELEGYYYMLIKKIDNSELTPEDMKEYQFMLKAGIDEKPYEPFTNGASPNPDYPQEIKVIEGIENLFDGIFRQGAYNSTTNRLFVHSSSNKKLSKGMYTFSTNLPNTFRFWISGSQAEYPTNQTLIYSSNSKVGLTKFSFEFTEDLFVGIQIAKVDNSNITLDDIRDYYFQIEKGSVAHSYVPYGNHLVVKNIGDNLLKPVEELKTTTINGITFTPVFSKNDSLEYINVNGTATNSVNFNIAYNILEAGNYILTALTGGSSSTYYLRLGTDKTVGSTFIAQVGTGNTSFTLNKKSTVGANIIVRNGITVNNVKFYPMIRLASIENTAYKPYEETISYIPLNGNFIAKINDEIRDRLYLQNGHAYIDKRIGKVIIDGGQGIGKEADKHFYFTKNDFARLMDYTNSIISDKYISVKNQGGLITGISGYASKTAYPGQNWIYIYDEKRKDMTVDEFKEYLKLNPVIVYYPLVTPKTIDLGEVSIPTLKGTNNLFIESNLEPSNASIKYYLDTEFNDIYTTHEEAHAMINMTDKKIEQSVSEVKTDFNAELDNYYTKIESDTKNTETKDGITTEISRVENKVNANTDKVESVNKQLTEITKAVDGVDISIKQQQSKYDSLNNKLVTLEGTLNDMNFNFSTKGLKIGTSIDPNNSLLDNHGIRVYNLTKLMAIFNNKGSGVEKLIVTGTAQVGYFKIEKSTKTYPLNGTSVTEKVNKHFYLEELIEDITELEVE